MMFPSLFLPAYTISLTIVFGFDLRLFPPKRRPILIYMYHASTLNSH